MLKSCIYVVGASYVEEHDAIALIGKDASGNEGRHMIPSSAFYFGNLDKKEEMIKTAELMTGKTINIEYDPDLQRAIEEKVTKELDRK